MKAYSCEPSNEESIISWPNTDAFKEVEKNLVISATEAHKLLVEKTKSLPKKYYFDRRPLFLVDNKYFFTEPNKEYLYIQGFYVDGNTQAIEYRYSSKRIKAKQGSYRSIPFRK